MRAVIQRVERAEVRVDGNIIGKIDRGLLVFLGIETEDGTEDIPWLARKIARMRIFTDPESESEVSVKDIKGELLLVSQFTLHASTKKGNRPSYIRAARPEQAEPLYEQMKRQLELELPGRVATGTFGAMMEVELINDGPITIGIDSRERE